MSERSYFGFRLAILLFALLLGVQCVWLLLAEFSRPGIYRLPADAAAAAAARSERINARRAAVIGVIRGDLWRLLFRPCGRAPWNPVTITVSTRPTLDSGRLSPARRGFRQDRRARLYTYL